MSAPRAGIQSPATATSGRGIEVPPTGHVPPIVRRAALTSPPRRLLSGFTRTKAAGPGPALSRPPRSPTPVWEQDYATATEAAPGRGRSCLARGRLGADGR